MGLEHHCWSREVPLAAGKDARARCTSIASLAEASGPAEIECETCLFLPLA